jgi:hypothetical protein
MLEELERRNYSEATTRCYSRTVEDFSRRFKRSPNCLGPEHHRGSGPVVRFCFRVGAWDNAALVDFARYALRTEVISSPVGLVPTNAHLVSV